MPTILNNACINRVAKIKKVLFTSNDLTALKATPYTLLNIKDGNICRVPFLIFVLCDSDADYTGQLTVNTGNIDLNTFSSYNQEEGYFSIITFSGSEPNVVSLKAEEDFNVGTSRGPIELHIYYYEESVSVPFEFEFVDNS